MGGLSGGSAPHPVLLGAAARVPGEPRRTPGAPCRGGWPALLHCSVTDAAVSKNHEGKKGGEEEGEEESLRGDARGSCRLCRVLSKPGLGRPGDERTRWLPGAAMSPDPVATNCCQCTGLIRETRERGKKKRKKNEEEKNKRKILESLFFSSLFAWVFAVPARAGAAAGHGANPASQVQPRLRAGIRGIWEQGTALGAAGGSGTAPSTRPCQEGLAAVAVGCVPVALPVAPPAPHSPGARCTSTSVGPGWLQRGQSPAWRTARPPPAAWGLPKPSKGPNGAKWGSSANGGGGSTGPPSGWWPLEMPPASLEPIPVPWLL